MKLEQAVSLIKAGKWNTWRKENPSQKPSLNDIELIGCNLDGIDFSELSLENATICECSLKNASCISSIFKHANLSNNDFENAKLIAANLDHANVSNCRIKNTNFLMASVQEVKFDEVDFSGQDLRTLNLRQISLVNCNLSGQNLSRLDLSSVNMMQVNLNDADLSNANLTRVTLIGANLINTNLEGAIFHSAELQGINLRGKNLEKTDFKGANLSFSDLREANLTGASIADGDLTGCKLWKARTNSWDISSVKCKSAFWDKEGIEKTEYVDREFERLYTQSSTLELRYPYRLTINELVTLPILIEHLQASRWGSALRLKSVDDVAGGGARVTLAIDEYGKHHPSALKIGLQEEANRIHTAQLALHADRKMQIELKEEIAGIKERFWPRLLELAPQQREHVRNLTVIFMDLKGFSKWTDDELSDKLALFRGLVKPVLNRWQASHPNMEGDSLRITFRNATAGLACACMLRGVLFSAGFELRMGVELGEVSIVHNEVTDLSDIEGTAVIMAARLESAGLTGQVVATQKVRHYTDYKGIFKFHPITVTLTKNIGDKKAGDTIDCFTVDVIKPLLDIH